MERLKEVFNIRAIVGFFIWVAAIIVITVVGNMLLSISFKQMLTSEFWADAGVKILIKYLGTTGTSMIVVSLYNNKKNVKASREVCTKLLKTKNNKFSEFIENEDRLSKINAWKMQQRNKINSLLIKIEKIRKEHKRDILRKKVDALRLTIEDDYIIKNFDRLVVKYPRRLENSFLYADALATRETAELDVNIDKKINQEVFKGLVGTILLSMAFALLIPESADIPTRVRILKLILNSIVLLTATATGIKNGFNIGNDYILNNLLLKIEIMYKFIYLEYGLDERDPDLILKKIHLDKEKKDLGTNLALQIQSGDIKIIGNKFIETKTSQIIAEKV